MDSLRSLGGLAGELDELHRLDGLRNAVFLDQEVGRLEVFDRVAVAVDDRDVDADEIDLGAEDGCCAGLGSPAPGPAARGSEPARRRPRARKQRAEEKAWLRRARMAGLVHYD